MPALGVDARAVVRAVSADPRFPVSLLLSCNKAAPARGNTIMSASYGSNTDIPLFGLGSRVQHGRAVLTARAPLFGNCSTMVNDLSRPMRLRLAGCVLAMLTGCSLSDPTDNPFTVKADDDGKPTMWAH